MSKYDEVLRPFVAMMEKELHANAGKGDRPGWLAMSADTCLLEIFYHLGKLQKAVKKSEGDGIGEYAADVANMCMMLADICGVLALANPVPPAGGDVEVLGYIDRASTYYPSLESVETYGQRRDVRELVDRAHVTRLQAEVERLKIMSENYCSLLMDANSELTKARELWATEQAIKEQPGEDVLWQVLDAAVGVLTRRAAPHAWESEAFEAGRKIIMARREGLIATAPNQSAPADKCHGEPHAHEWDINDQGTATVCSVCGVRSSDEQPAPVEGLRSALAECIKQRDALKTAPVAVVHPFAEKVISKLRRFKECADDFESGGADIGRHWFDILERLGLLNRVQRSPALWEMTQQGEDCLDEIARLNGVKP